MDPDVLFYWILVPTIKIAIVMAILPLFVAAATLAERKIIAFMQVRLGPMRVGPKGILQPIADVAKLFLKEDINPSKANKAVFILAPILSVIPAFLAMVVFPFGPEVAGWADKIYFRPLVWIAHWVGANTAHPLPMVITDLDIGLLFVVSISSLGVFAILLAGWASNSKYPLLGGLRSAAQLISYEVPLGFALIAGLMMTKTLSIPGIVEAQRDLGMPLFLLQPVSLFLYFISGVAETNRVPFDLPEAETELVAGFHTEYSGMKFAFFFLAEYINMITVSAIAAVMFLGGWLVPAHGLWRYLGWDKTWMAWAYGPIASFLWITLKIALLYYLYFWLRATLPRYRYDQLMALGWKWLIPISMLNVFQVGVAVAIKTYFNLPNVAYLGLMVANLLLLLVILHVARGLKRGEDAKPALRTVY